VRHLQPFDVARSCLGWPAVPGRNPSDCSNSGPNYCSLSPERGLRSARPVGLFPRNAARSGRGPVQLPATRLRWWPVTPSPGLGISRGSRSRSRVTIGRVLPGASQPSRWGSHSRGSHGRRSGWRRRGQGRAPPAASRGGRAEPADGPPPPCAHRGGEGRPRSPLVDESEHIVVQALGAVVGESSLFDDRTSALQFVLGHMEETVKANCHRDSSSSVGGGIAGPSEASGERLV